MSGKYTIKCPNKNTIKSAKTVTIKLLLYTSNIDVIDNDAINITKAKSAIIFFVIVFIISP